MLNSTLYLWPLQLLFIVLSLLLAQGQVQAQSAGPQAPSESSLGELEALDRTIELLRDHGKRDELIRKLEGLREGIPIHPVTSSTPDATTLDAEPTEIVTQEGVIGAMVATFAESFADVSAATFGMPLEDKLRQAGSELGQRADNAFGGVRLLDFLGWALPGILLVVSAYAALTRVAFVRDGRRFERRPTAEGLPFVRLVLGRLLFGIAPVLVAGAIASTYATWMAPTFREGQLFAALLSPLVAALLARRLVFFVLLLLGPTRGWRIVGYASRRFLPWMGALAALAACANLLREFTVRVLLGVNFSDVAALAVDLTLAVLTASFVVSHRLTVRTLLLRGRRAHDADGSKASGALAGAFDVLADWWHVVALAFIAANVLARILGLGGGSFVWESAVSVVWLIGGFLGLAVLNYVFSRLAQSLERGKFSVRRAVFRRYIDIAHLLVQIAVVVVVLLQVLDTWGFPLSSWLNTDPGRRLMRPLASLVIVPALIYALWTTIDTAITSALAPRDGAGRPRERSARVRTLLPLVRNLIFVVLIVVTVIAVLANIGIDVVPLLAGAGVIGLAFSLGAQQLVKDVIAGFFIIFEDTIAIGDRVTTGDKSGTIEGITIRTMRLRETSGAVHSIPFGQIATLRNDSRGFGVYPLEVSVSAQSKVEDAMAALQAVGQEMWREPEWRRRMIAPPTIFGVDAIGAANFTLTGEIRSQPLQQGDLGREYLLRLKRRFEAEGLVFA